MTTFSVASQSVICPGGYRVEFSVDPADYAKCICRVHAIGSPDAPDDYMETVFARNGMAMGTRMVDAEVEAEAAVDKPAEPAPDAVAAPAPLSPKTGEPA